MDATIDYDLIKEKEVFVATTFLGEERRHFYDLLKTNFDHYFKEDKNMIIEQIDALKYANKRDDALNALS